MCRFLFVFFINGIVYVSAFSQNLNQNLITSSGNYFTSGAYNLSWSIGEVVTATHSAGTNKLTQGFHQPPIRVTSIAESDILIFKVYPNPTSSGITILILNGESRVECFLSDLLGRQLLYSTEQSANKIYMDLNQFSSGFYFLNIKQKDKKEFSRFKIQKID
jgi:hypothetical protein